MDLSLLNGITTLTLIKLGIGLAFILFIIRPFFKSLDKLIKAIKSKRWPKKEAVILRSDILESMRPHRETIYEIDFKYEFMVRNSTFISKSRFLAEELGTSNPFFIKKFTVEHKVGDKITVYHDPENPNLSTVYNTIKPYYILIPLFFSAVLLIGISSLISGILDLMNL